MVKNQQFDMMFIIYVGISSAFVASLQTPNLHTNSNALLKSEEFTPPDSTHASPFVGYSTPSEISRNAYVPPEHDNVGQLTKKENFNSTKPPIPNKLLSSLYNWQTMTTSATDSWYDEIAFLYGTENELNSFIFDVEAPIETMRTFCPRTKYCHSETWAETYEDIGRDCCLPCDCSDSCFDVGNCCFDKTNDSQQHQVNTSVSDKAETCVQTFLAGSDYGINYMNSSFLLFQTCVNNGNEQAKMKCLQPNVSTMSEMTPVFSHNTERHYRNIYCAQCNSDSLNTTEWQIRLQCNTEANISLRVPEFTKQSDFSPLQMIASNPKCVMFWHSPSNQMEAPRCLNNHDIISSCYTPELHDLCKNYYFPVKGENKIFRNIFCMECLLRSNFTGVYPSCQDVVFIITNNAFTAILSLNENQGKESRTTIAKNNCPLQRPYNKELDACILHTCSVTEVGVIGDCLSMFSELNGINIDYRLKVLYPKNARLVSMSRAQYEEVTLNVVGLSAGMGICWYGIYGTELVDDFVEIKVQIVKNVGNIRINIQKSYFELENNIKTYNEHIKNDASAFRLQIDTSDFDPIPDGLMSPVKFADDLGATHCQNKIAFSKMQFCDTITFLEHEFKMHDNGNISIDDVMLVPGEFILRQRADGTFKSVQICLDHYISRHAKVTNRSAIGVRTGHVTLLSALAASVAVSIGQN